jgi:hypothetical protein
MALRITQASRGGPGCDHYRITVTDDGTPRTFGFTWDAAQLRDRLEDLHPTVALVLLWIRYKLSKGATPASLVGVDIA